MSSSHPDIFVEYGESEEQLPSVGMNTDQVAEFLRPEKHKETNLAWPCPHQSATEADAIG